VTRFNLSEWALKHRAFVWYLMLAALVGGVLSYQNLGREEDPPFTIKTMIVQANWPGATVDEMINQVTDRIERKLEELGNLDFTNSYTSPGQTTVFVNLHENVRGPEIRATWISATRSPTSRQSCRPGCRVRSSTTSSATSMGSSTPLRPTGFRSASCAIMPNRRAPRS
jgi:multidrug efflux pump